MTAHFRMGEAEVARAFFKSPRPLDQHVKWLKHQIMREARNLRETSNRYDTFDERTGRLPEGIVFGGFYSLFP